MQRELKAVALFCVIAFVVSWGIVGAMFLAGLLTGTQALAGKALASLLFPAGTAVAAVATVYWWKQRVDAASLGFTFRHSHWLLLAWLCPALVALLTLLICKFIPDLSLSFDPSAHPLAANADEQMRKDFEAAKSTPPALRFIAYFTGSLFMATLLYLVFRVAEEIGWRGLLLRLLAPFGFWRASILVGILAGIWSMPLVLLGNFYPEHPQQGLFLIVALTLLMSPLITFFRLRSGSVAGAAIFTASMAAMTRFVMIPYVSGSDLLYGIPGIAGMVALVIVNVLVVVPRWREADADLRELVKE
jgi:membrane protease YdiL (CAAX protease family)